MKCVVTGAIGFVGLNVTRALAREGHDVIAVTRREPDEWATRFLQDSGGRVTFRLADVSVAGALNAALAEEQLDVFIHAAVITATTARVERDEPLRIVDVNVGGTMAALDAARRRNAARFIYVSSPAAIGDVSLDSPLNEETVANPTTIYGITKRASEQLVRRFAELHDLRAASVRIAQPYGPGERATPSRPRTSPIYEWLVAASAGETLVTGPMGVGRDWTYVDDTARGIVTIATGAAPRDELYHLNRRQQALVGDVIGVLRDRYPGFNIDDRPEAPGLNPNIAGTSRRAPMDNRRFEREYGWAPSIDIAEGMRRYLDWWDSWSI